MTDAQFAALAQAALDRVCRLRERAAGLPIWAGLTEEVEEVALAFEELRGRNATLVESEARAAAERNRYRDLFESAPFGYLLTDGDGMIRELNRAACALLRVAPAQAVEKSLSAFIRKEDRPAFQKQLTAIQKGESAGQLTLRIQPRGVGLGPRVVDLAVVAERDAQTSKSLLRWQTREVTESAPAAETRRGAAGEALIRERTAELERQLREELALRGRLTHLATASQLLATAADLDRTLKAVTELYAGLADWSFVELADDRGRCRWAPLRLAEPGQVRWLESAAPAVPVAERLPRQAVFANTAAPPAALNPAAIAQCRVFVTLGWRSALWMPLVVESRVIGALALGAGQPGRWADAEVRLIEELADRVAAAIHIGELVRRLNMEAHQRDEFLATVGHELRNHLTPIRNALEIIRLSPPGSATAERARAMIDRQTVQHARLIDHLLDISRMSLGKVQLQRAPLDLAQAAADAASADADQFRVRGVQLTREFPAEPVVVLADPTRLDEILTHLLANAIQVTNPGGRVELCVHRHGEWGEVRVRDTGVGIAPDALPHVFGLGVPVERPDDGLADGVVVGLHIVKQLVELHGGAVVAHSEGLGRGSEFIVRLPIPTTRAAPVGERGT